MQTLCRRAFHFTTHPNPSVLVRSSLGSLRPSHSHYYFAPTTRGFLEMAIRGTDSLVRRDSHHDRSWTGDDEDQDDDDTQNSVIAGMPTNKSSTHSPPQ
jgi:hypothetical protein